MTKADVSTPSPRMAELEKKRKLCRDLMGGTTAMIEAGQTWLPKHPGESDKNYEVRLKSNILTNFLEQAISKQTGKIFSKAIAVGDNVPEPIKTVCENIDRQGRGLDAFLMDVSTKAFTDGISYILADMPKTQGVMTVAEEKAAGIRPYAIHIEACCILEVVAEMIGGVETVTRVRIRECLSKPEPDSWEYETIDQIRVLKLLRSETGPSVVDYELHRQNEKKEWVLFEEGTTTLKRIALVPIYTNRCGFMEGQPPNQAIAELNLRHWRSTSEQINALSFQRFAMLSATGVGVDDAIEVGPSKVLKSSNPDAEFGYVEPTGKGVEMGRLDLEGIEKQIETASAQLRIERGGQVTATAAAIDSAEGNAGLKAVANGMKDSIEQLFMFFAEMMGLGEDKGGEVTVNTDFGQAKGTPQGLQEITKLRANGDISRKRTIETMKWRGEIPEDFDAELNEEELQDEGPALGTITPKEKSEGGNE